MPSRWPGFWRWFGAGARREAEVRRATGEALRASEEKFAAAFALSPQAISITAIPSGRFLDVNDALVRFSGYDRDELLGRTPVDLGLWADAAEWEHGRELLLREGRLPQREVRFRRKDGDIIVGLAAAERIALAGQPAILTVVADITARKRAEEALRESEARLRAVLRALPVAVWLTDAHGAILLDNPAGARIWGEATAGAAHRGRYQGWRAETDAPLAPEDWSLARTLATGEAVVGEVLDIAAADGTRRTILSSTAPLADDAGTIQGAVVVNEDITTLRQVERELRANEARLRLALQANRMATWEWDLAADRLIAGANIAEVYGLPALATAAEGRALIWPEDRPAHRARVERAAREGGEYRSEFRITRPVDGRLAWLEERAAALVDAAGKVTSLVGVVADITERKLADAALRAGEERYRILVESIDQGVCILEMLYGADGRPTDYRFLEVNPTFERHTGLRDAVGKTARELVPGLEDSWVEIYGRVAETGTSHRFEQGSAAMGRWFEVQAVRVGGAGSRRVALFFTDVSGRRRAEADTAFRLALAERIRLTGDAEGLLAAIPALIGEHLHVDRCFFFEIARDTRTGVIASDYRRGDAPSLVGTFDRQVYSPITGAELAAGRTVVVADTRADPRTAPWYDSAYGPGGEGALVAVPLWRDSEWRATLLAIAARPREWQPREVALLRDAGEQTWLAVEKLRLDAALRASEERLSLALAGAQAAAWQWDLAAHRVIWSPEQYDLLGLPRGAGEFPAGTFTELVHPADRERVEAEMAAAIERGGPFEIEYRINHRDGTERWLNSVGRVERDERGAPTLAIGINQDFTARRRAEARIALLGEVSGLLAGLLDEGPALQSLARLLVRDLADWCLISTLEPDGRVHRRAVAHADPEREALLRQLPADYPYDPAQRHGAAGVIASGRSRFSPSLTPGQLAERTSAPNLSIFQRLGVTSGMIVPLRARGGTFGAVSLLRADAARPYAEADLALAEQIADRAAATLDSARLYAAERRARAEAEAARARLAFLADAGVVLAGSLDEEATLASLAGLIVPGFADWCTINLIGDDGLRPPIALHSDPARQPALEELLRRYPADIRGNGPLAQVLRTGEALLLVAEEGEVVRAYAPDAPYLELLARIGLAATIIVPLRARQRLLGALRFARVAGSRPYDAGDLRLAEEVASRAALALDNARLYREARDAVAARDRFLSIAAHELRTPVTSMRAYAQLARRRIERGQLAPELIDNALSSIERGTSRLNTLIQDLLDVARLQSGQLRIDRAPLDLAALVETAAAEAQSQLPAGLALTVAGTSRPYRVLGDAGRLEQVLGNLLDNARKYSPEGGTIAVTLATDARGATVAVRDEGIGFAPEEAQAIFVPFNRSEEALRRQIQGLGLGLAICRAIVAEHSGTLLAASEGEGRGTVFTLWLPAAPELAATRVATDGAAVAEDPDDEAHPDR